MTKNLALLDRLLDAGNLTSPHGARVNAAILSRDVCATKFTASNQMLSGLRAFLKSQSNRTGKIDKNLFIHITLAFLSRLTLQGFETSSNPRASCLKFSSCSERKPRQTTSQDVRQFHS